MLSLMDYCSVDIALRIELSVEKLRLKEPGRGKHSSRSRGRMVYTCVVTAAHCIEGATSAVVRWVKNIEYCAIVLCNAWSINAEAQIHSATLHSFWAGMGRSVKSRWYGTSTIFARIWLYRYSDVMFADSPILWSVLVQGHDIHATDKNSRYTNMQENSILLQMITKYIVTWSELHFMIISSNIRQLCPVMCVYRKYRCFSGKRKPDFGHAVRGNQRRFSLRSFETLF